MNGLTIDAVFTAIAQKHADRPCIIEHGRSTNYGTVLQNSGRLAAFLAGHGLGLRSERNVLAPWQSGQDHVGLLMYNCAEYLEAELAAVRGRLAAININYRYVAEELAYLFRDAGLKALIFHSSCAPQVAAMLPYFPYLKPLIQVPDASGAPLVEGAIWYADALETAPEGLSLPAARPDDVHILYTGGTTGRPKGVLWRQDDILITGLGGRRPDGRENMLEDFLHSADRSASRTLPAGPFMHASGRWTAISQLMLGNIVVLPGSTRSFDAADIWATVARERVNGLNIVGDAMARPLIKALEEGAYDLSSLRLISSGAAVLSEACKREFLQLLPDIQISDTVGSSETGPQASTVSRRGTVTPQGNFGPAAGTTILNAEGTAVLAPTSDEIGWLARGGRMPLGYLGDREKTERTFRVIDGIRYAVPGDRARWNAEDHIQLLGRDAATINSGGEKIFAEEVEMALKQHPSIADAIVCGRPSERWGQEVVAIIAMRSGPGIEDGDASILEECGRHVARYKLPKQLVRVAMIRRSPSGKPDYDWARSIAIEALPNEQETA